VYRDAVSHNLGFRAAQAGRDAEREGEAIARSSLLPSVSLSGSGSRMHTDRSIADLGADRYRYNSYQYGINLRQPLYRPYEQARYQQAVKQSEAADAQLNVSRNTLMIETLASYFDAAYSDNLIHLLQARHASAQAQLRAAEKALDAGSGSRIEISEARAQRDIIEAQRLEAQNQQDHALRTLQSYVGRPLERIAALSPERFSTELPRLLDLNGWINAAVAGSTELALAQAQVEVARKEIDKASAGHWPTVDLVAAHTHASNDSLASLNNLGDTRYRQNSAGIQVNIPVFSGGSVSAAERQAAFKLTQAQLLADDTRQRLEVNVRQAYGTLTQGVVKIRAYEQAEASASENLIATRKGIQAGTRSSLDVFVAETQLYTTRRDLYLARYQLLLSRLRLLSFTGELADADVAQISAWFAPETRQGAVLSGQ
jgi:TolC family type I secretion outer membrane protein